MQMKHIALLPVFNPSYELLNLLQELYDSGFEIVVVNDGSGLDCEKLFFDCSRYAEVLHHEKNQGNETALKTGLRYIYRTYRVDCVVVMLDIIGQYFASNALIVAQKADALPHSLICGYKKSSKKKSLGNQFENCMLRLASYVFAKHKNTEDETKLLAFNGCFIPKIITIEGSQYEQHILRRFAKDKASIVEVEL